MTLCIKAFRHILFSALFALSFTAQANDNSRCHLTPATDTAPEKIDCDLWTLSIKGTLHGYNGFPDIRDVLYSVPLGEAPAEGWPIAVVYQGSFFPVQFADNHTTDDMDSYFGAFYELRTIKELLDNGYAVMAPRAFSNVAWQTNVPNPYGYSIYTTQQDYPFLKNLFKEIKKGTFDRHGKLNPNKKFATGISSGGYNSSRMAVSFPGEFTALAIHSASYASCNGSLCNIPSTMPKDHPPTVFLHGRKDPIVPVSTMERYYSILKNNSIETKKHVFPEKGHEVDGKIAQNCS